MTPSPDTQDDRARRLAAVIEDARILHAAGRSIDSDALCRAHPDLLPELAAQLKILQRIDDAFRAAGQLDPLVTTTSAAPGSKPPGPTAQALADELAKPTIEIPGYTLLREVARGGQAIVYKAIQNSTGKTVAVKPPRAACGVNLRNIGRATFEYAAANQDLILAFVAWSPKTVHAAGSTSLVAIALDAQHTYGGGFGALWNDGTPPGVLFFPHRRSGGAWDGGNTVYFDDHVEYKKRDQLLTSPTYPFGYKLNTPEGRPGSFNFYYW